MGVMPHPIYLSDELYQRLRAEVDYRGSLSVAGLISQALDALCEGEGRIGSAREICPSCKQPVTWLDHLPPLGEREPVQCFAVPVRPKRHLSTALKPVPMERSHAISDDEHSVKA